MTKQRHSELLITGFALVTGFIIGALIWLYLKASNVGVTLIWETIGGHFPTAVYTLIVCLAGGLVIGLFHRKYGPLPENMADAVRHVIRERSYPYRQMPIAIIAALLSLLFGGAIGPEAGLVCMLISLSFWAQAMFGLAYQNMQSYFESDPGFPGVRVFGNLIKEMVLHPGRVAYEKNKGKWPRRRSIICGIATGLGGLFVYILLGELFGHAFTLPRIEGGAVQVKDRMFMILLFAVGIAAGYLYLALRKVTSKFFDFMRGKGLEVLNAILGGLILGLIGGQFPLTMFSGCADIQTIQGGYMNSVPYMLVVVGILKLLLTNVCIESGWRGGHFFPLLFSGLSIGYGFAGLLGTNEILSVVVVTGALLATVLQQPLGALALSVIFFPLREVGWMALVTLAAGCIPLPVPMRADPENKGFVSNVVQQIGQRRASNQKKIEDEEEV